MKYLFILLFVLAANYNYGQNLIQNPDCEIPLVNNKIPNWTEVIGNEWSIQGTDDFPVPQNGKNYFCAGNVPEAELAQTIPLDDYKCLISQGNLSVQFDGYVRAYLQDPPDQSQIIIEMVSGGNTVLEANDLGTYSPTREWRLVSKLMNVPPLTQKIRIRLLSHRRNGRYNDGYFDNLSLVPIKKLSNAITANLNKTICQGEAYAGYNASGIYRDTLKTANGCDSIRVLDLKVLEIPKIAFNDTREICPGQTITIAPAVTPNSPSLTYKWSTGESVPAITVASAGTYALTVTDGTCSATATTSISLSSSVVLKPDETTCLSASAIILTSGVADNELRYSWTPTNSTGPTLSVSQSGKYQVTVTSKAGCKSQRTITVLDAPKLDLGNDKAVCDGESVEIIPTVTGLEPFTYKWSSGETTKTIKSSRPGIYKLTVTQTGCSASDSLEVKVLPLPTVLRDTTVCRGEPLVAGNPNTSLSYLWEHSGETTREVKVQADGEYRVKITSNQSGCSRTRTLTVGICGAYVLAPTAFTPNNDGVNDIFKLTVVGGSIIRLDIYNRWGEPIFTDENSDPQWDGRFQNESCIAGAYTYVLKYKHIQDGSIQNYNGMIMLIK